MQVTIFSLFFFFFFSLHRSILLNSDSLLRTGPVQRLRLSARKHEWRLVAAGESFSVWTWISESERVVWLRTSWFGFSDERSDVTFINSVTELHKQVKWTHLTSSFAAVITSTATRGRCLTVTVNVRHIFRSAAAFTVDPCGRFCWTHRSVQATSWNRPVKLKIKAHIYQNKSPACVGLKLQDENDDMLS